MTIHHLNCGRIAPKDFPPVPCHCLLLQAPGRRDMTLIDSGLGLLDCERPAERLGQDLIDQVGFEFDERLTAARQIESLGLSRWNVTSIVLTHADPDHTGGLADFPEANVFISQEELAAVEAGHPRYIASHFSHGPRWTAVGEEGAVDWFGLPARPLPTGGETGQLLLVPLFGHTAGHCGVAVAVGDRWLLHVGDAWYLRGELSPEGHPVSALAAARAIDNVARQSSLAQLKRLQRDHGDVIEFMSYHDPADWPVPQ